MGYIENSVDPDIDIKDVEGSGDKILATIYVDGQTSKH
jgi:hypothetical protein